MKKSNMSRKAGFTLVELMVVAIIVALLAAVAIPLMSANRKRAASTEGEAGLGTIRTALRAVYAERGVYNQNLNGGTIAAGSAVAGIVPGIQTNDLNGTYFRDTHYSIPTLTEQTYVLRVTGSTNKNVTGVTIELDQDGKFTYQGL
jgi:prepilin-type N-terminal cleavage/methylation domain-containing protein